MTTALKPVWPTKEGLPITSPYGWRTHPIDGSRDFHAAIDIGGGGVNHPIYATQAGKVIYNRWTDYGGWTIRIEHTGDSYYSQYQHMASQSPLAIGTYVTAGQVIGTMGTTGDSTGIHLDFAISVNGTFFKESTTIDPEDYLQGIEGGGDGDKPTPSQPNQPANPKTQYEYEKEGTWENMTYIKVKKGETLSSIAKRYGVPVDKIQRVTFESIRNKNLIQTGELLVVPTVKEEKPKEMTYIVKSGDNLTKIAKKLGVTVKHLADKNKIKNLNLIRVGQVLKYDVK